MNHNHLEISVVIPTLNRVDTLPRALKSVLKQTLAPIEIIVIDNGSVDSTIPVIKNDFPEVKLFVEPQIGVSCARNKGIKVASGKWIAFLDSDDEWALEKLEKQSKAHYVASDHRLIHTNEVWYLNGKNKNQMKKHRKYGGEIFKYCLDLCCISPSSAIVEKALLIELGQFDENLPACEDYDLWLRITAHEKVLFIDEPLTIKYGGHSDQLSKKYWGMDKFRIQSLEKLLLSGQLTRSKAGLTQKCLLKKINIFLNGAIKRDNKDLIEIYSKKRDHWENCV